MEKAPVKVRKEKKKNTETGLLMGQNTNIFSQLSAGYLTNKQTTTAEEQSFIKQTQIVQYHDQNINRLISLLRKKAEITKVKAVGQLKEEILKMNQNQIEQFLPTYSNLFQQIVLNEQSKQVFEEFVQTTCSIFQKYKKVALKEIQTFYPSMLISIKLSKIVKLLFNGSQQQMNQKAFVLFIKKQIRKKFMLVSKLLLQTDQIHLINQSNYQRNIGQYAKAVKQLFNIYLNHSKKNQLKEDTQNLAIQITELLSGKTIDQYFKCSGKGKASLLQLFDYIVHLQSLQGCQLPWRKFAKIIGQNFLDKDSVVQSSLWRYCNKDLLESLHLLGKNSQKQDQTKLLNQIIPKYEDKLLQCLNIGGISMYKALPSYIQACPPFDFSEKDTHKSLVQKITYIRKFLQCILSQQDENQARMQCYYLVSKWILQRVSKLQEGELEKILGEKQGEGGKQGKKEKEVKSLIEKLRTEIVSSLQKKFYAEPAVSKNSFTYYIPSYFCKLLNNHHQIIFTPTFNQKLTFQLYQNICLQSPILQTIYNSCESNLTLLLLFFENWPHSDKQVNLDMTEANNQYQKTAKIYFLSNKKNSKAVNTWFLESWDLRKSAIIYDPRLTTKDLQVQASQQGQQFNIHFVPISKNIPLIYKNQQLDQQRFKFFCSLLQNQQIQVHSLQFFMPYFFQSLINEANINVLLDKYIQKSNLLKLNKWVIGEKQIAFLVIAVEAFNKYLLQNHQNINQNLLNRFNQYFLTIGNFLKTLNVYKMDKKVVQILKSINQLLKIQQFQSKLFQCTQSILRDIFSQLNKSSSISSQNQQKLKKNRLKRINEFVEQTIWYLVRKNTDKQILLFLDLLREQNLWNQAEKKMQPWAIGYTILQNSDDNIIRQMGKQIVENFDQNYKTISLLLSIQLIVPLSIYPQIKRAYIKLQHAIVKAFSHLEVQKKLICIQKLISYQYEYNLLTESLGLKNLIKHCLKNYQSFTPQQMLILSKDIVQYLITNILNQKQVHSKLNIKTIICINFLNQMPLQDLYQIQIIYQNILIQLQRQIKNLQSHFNRFLSVCLIANCFWRTSIGFNISIKWQQNNLIEGLLNQLIPQITQIQPLSTYHSLVIYSTVNSLYLIFGFQVIESSFQSLVKILWEKTQNQAQNEFYIFKQQQRIRFLSRVFFNLKSQLVNQIIQRIPHQALTEYNHYEKVLLQIEEEQQDSQSHQAQKSVHGLFIEYSELIMKMTTCLNIGESKSIPNQTILIELLQCPFPGVKKTCFMLLKQMYDFKLVKGQIPQIFKQVLKLKLKNDDDLQDVKTVNLIYNFLYSWLTIIIRKKSTEIIQNQNDEQSNQSLQDYIQNQGLSQLFLHNIFTLISDKLDYIKYESDFPLTYQDLLTDDFTLNVEEDSHLLKKIFTLSCKTLFEYSMNFPLYLRNYVDKSKKYRVVCQKLLRNFISQAIFSRQIAMIEARQPQWKANKNLQIYVVKKNKQIYAQYQHEAIRIGLRLVMKSNYPLTPIHIEFGEGLKLEQGSKWGLMLQSQLHNRNNSIINGIILWKENIDKKLSGVEQCAICYDIVNSMNQLPKKGCKTCKKKFHGNCIMKWFSKSNKSECPLCKSHFL